MVIPMEWLAAWLIAVNLTAAVMTAVDKRRAKRGRWRIPENTLLFVAALGGAPAMLAMMRLVRHKTRHRKFMWGLPVLLVLQAALLLWLVHGGILSFA